MKRINKILDNPFLRNIVFPILTGFIVIVLTILVFKSGNDNDIKEINLSATIDNPNQPQQSKIFLQVLVFDQNKKPVHGAEIEAIIKFKTRSRGEKGTTNIYGEWEWPIQISNAAIGFKVVIEINTSYNKLVDKTTTSFTPIERLEGGMMTRPRSMSQPMSELYTPLRCSKQRLKLGVFKISNLSPIFQPSTD